MRKKTEIVTSLVMVFLIVCSFSIGNSLLLVSAQQRNIVHFVQNNEWSSLNPFLARTRADFTVTGLIYEPLVVVKPSGEPVPWLATDWSASQDGKTLTFHLNQTAKWADGQPVTANDVKFTWDTMLQKGLSISISPDLITSVNAVDDSTVTFSLSTTYAPFLVGIAQWMIVPKHIWQDIAEPEKYQNTDPTKAFGSGPMKLVQWNVGQFAELTTNTNYWKQEINIDGIIIDLYKESGAGILAVKKGEADAYDGVPPEGIPSLLGVANLTINVSPSATNMRFVGLNLRIYPNNVTELRKAIDLAVDKDNLIQQIDYGYAVITSMGYIPEALSYWNNPNCTWAGLDMTDAERIETANTMLDQIGFARGTDGVRVTPNGTRCEFTFNVFAGWSNFQRMAELVRDSCEEIGIKVNVVPMDTTSLVNLVYGGQSLTGWTWLPAEVVYAPDPDFFTSEWGHDPVDPWWCGDAYDYNNPALTEALQAARREVNQDQRKALFLQAQQIFANDCPVIMLESVSAIIAYRTDKFAGWDPSAGVGYPSLIVAGVESLPSVINLQPVSAGQQGQGSPSFIETYGLWIAAGVIAAVVVVGVGIYVFRKRAK
jgi:peptide/nickel transport system substrate-binding protein